MCAYNHYIVINNVRFAKVKKFYSFFEQIFIKYMLFNKHCAKYYARSQEHRSKQNRDRP